MSTQHEVRPLPFAYDAVEGISEQVIRWHHSKIYTAYVEQLNEAVRKLEVVDRSAVNPLQSEYCDLRRNELRITNGMRLHQLFFESLGGDGNPAGARIHDRIKDDFGSFDTWVEDFTACARASDTWALLAYDAIDDRLRNLLADEDSTGGWGMHPLVVIDLAEHAYYYDHGPKRGAYIKAFIANLNWKAIDKRYTAVVQE